ARYRRTKTTAPPVSFILFLSFGDLAQYAQIAAVAALIQAALLNSNCFYSFQVFCLALARTNNSVCSVDSKLALH
ncbi:MAG: hypothetical protein IJJ26_09565, partial [Victivallales bacterium]|nr:hypothetical protein [Victivallales bacterium]